MQNIVLAAVVIVIIVITFMYRGSVFKTAKTQDQTPAVTNAALLQTNGPYTVVTAEPRYFSSTSDFLAQPKEKGAYPGVVMVHEWWGLNDNIINMARQLAAQGYVVLAVDLYDGKVAKTPKEAQAYVSTFDKTRAVPHMQAAFDYLRQAGATKIGVLGWCFGGGQALQFSLSGASLNATVIYYGTPLVTDKTQLAAIKWPVLGVFGDKDQAIPLPKIKDFQAALNEDQIKNEIAVYPGVGHAFANPSGQSYAPAETKDAWTKTLQFLHANLQ